MKNPLVAGEWLTLDSVESTQDFASSAVLEDLERAPAVVFARLQTKGRGRFNRPWVDQPNNNLAVSFVFKEYADHPKPWLIGMGVALAAATLLDCKVQWPNDLVIHNKKLGGILTEMIPAGNNGRIPVVGIGINLNTQNFPPEIQHRATSLCLHHPASYDPLGVAQKLVEQFQHIPEPDHWAELEDLWNHYDSTPGKVYQTQYGEEILAMSVGSEGELIGLINGMLKRVYAAEAIMGE
jgi:BirA family biotin operon repressor/biotin-[acetyl-CoA-carboxylase] ligase